MVRVTGFGVTHSNRTFPKDYSELNRSEVITRGKKVALIAAGGMSGIAGGIGEKIAAFNGMTDMKVRCYGLPREFKDIYNARQLLAECGMTPDALFSVIMG